MVRYGVVGAGMMGLEHMNNILHLDGARVTAVADPHGPSVDAARASVGDPALAVFSDHRELVEADVCDAIVVATPNYTHVDVLADLLPTDLHLLIEKPLCTTVADCLRVVEAAEGREALTWMGLEYRYMAPVAALLGELEKGTHGRLQMLSIREHRFPFLPKVDDWNRFSENTGGTLVEKACHFFDLMNAIVGDWPVRVMASGAQDVNHLDERYDGRTPDILDNAYVIIEYRGGVRAMLDLCMFADAGRDQSAIIAVGDEGTLEARMPASELAVGVRGDTWFRPELRSCEVQDVPYMGLHDGSSYVEHRHFLDAIVNGGRPDVTLEDGMLSVAMGVAAHRSIESGAPVNIEDVLTDPTA